MITQALAILRRSEFTPTVVDWLVKGLAQYDLMTTGWNLSHDKDFISALTSVLQLIGDEQPLMDLLKAGLAEELPRLLEHIEVELGPDHVQVIPSLLWSVMCLGEIENYMGLVRKGLSEVSSYMKQHGSISFPSSILLNQLINHLYLLEISQSKHFNLELDEDLLQTIQTMAYRYDQLESRDNSDLSKKMFGVDLNLEVMKAFKASRRGRVEKYNV